MPRKKTSTNTLGRHAKRPTEVYAAIRDLYCRGRTQTRAERILDKWARRRGLKPVSRQTINAHFKQIGEILWYAWHTERFGFEPLRDDRPYSTHFADQYYLFPDHKMSKAFWEDKRLGRGFWRNPNLSDGTPMPSPARLFDTPVTRELRRVFSRSRGIDCSANSKTFYIHWMRARFLAGAKQQYPDATERSLHNGLFDYIARKTSLYKKPEAREPGGKGFSRNPHRQALYVEYWD